MRTVKIINIRTAEPVVVETSANNFGELKAQLAQMSQFNGTDFKSSKFTVKDKSISDMTLSRKSIGLDHEILPVGDFNLYISPSKVSQGGCGGHKVNVLTEFMRNVETLVAALASVKEEIEALVESYEETDTIDEIITVVETIDAPVANSRETISLDEDEEDDIEYLRNL
jgi:hypothetical protein